MIIKIINLVATLIGGTLITACASNAMTISDQHEALTVHNQLRKQHAAPALQWDASLARFAARYASHCQFKHSHGGYGENLAAGYPSVTAAIQAWYAEKKSYSYQRARYTPGTGHFTQMVWKASNKLGCAIVSCDGLHGTPGKFLVCEYSPAGNVINPGYFKTNVG